MMKLTQHTRKTTWIVPNDGARRFLYDTWQPFTLFVLMTCFTAIFFSMQDPYVPTDSVFFCNADGRVEKQSRNLLHKRYQPLWDPQLFFTINISFGRFSYTTAKVVDACWDAIIGRGGQMLAAMVAYRVLRRSLTLTMEASTVSIPTVTSICSQQVQFASMWEMLLETAFHFKRHRWGRYDAKPLGRLRLIMQVSAGMYVLAFATLVSVMTGYRAELRGFWDYSVDQTNELKPLSALSRPTMSVFGGSRIGLTDVPIYVADQIQVPTYISDNSTKLNATELLASSQVLEEPYGTFVDYFFTCFAVRSWLSEGFGSPSQLPSDNQTHLDCAHHNCSCTGPTKKAIAGSSSDVLLLINSTIKIDGRTWELPGPPLNISMSVDLRAQTAGCFGNDFPEDVFYYGTFTGGENYYSMRGISGEWDTQWAYNSATFDDAYVKDTGACVSDEAHSWGFSSLLLLTFCSYTLLFAIILILLQTDVYWNSRHDRTHQSYSIYTDILYLAEQLKAIFGHDIKGHLQSPKAFAKQVEGWKQGLRLEVEGLPPSRYQEWRSSLAWEGSDLDKDSLTHELSSLRSQDQAPSGVVGSADVVLASGGHGAVAGLTQKQAQQTFDAVDDDAYTSSHDQTGGKQKLGRRQ